MSKQHYMTYSTWFVVFNMLRDPWQCNSCLICFTIISLPHIVRQHVTWCIILGWTSCVISLNLRSSVYKSVNGSSLSQSGWRDACVRVYVRVCVWVQFFAYALKIMAKNYNQANVSNFLISETWESKHTGVRLFVEWLVVEWNLTSPKMSTETL